MLPDSPIVTLFEAVFSVLVAAEALTALGAKTTDKIVVANRANPDMALWPDFWGLIKLGMLHSWRGSMTNGQMGQGLVRARHHPS
ncbi:MAG: hypothetical protein ACLP7F_15880 [Acidimicrobiales bacterium]